MKSNKHSEAKSSDAVFKRLLGVKPEIFEKMASVLRKEYDKMHKLGGSPPKLRIVGIFDIISAILKIIIRCKRISVCIARFFLPLPIYVLACRCNIQNNSKPNNSYANDTATEDSDIDLVVILDTEEFAKTLNERLDRKQPINKSIRELRKDFAMDIIVYSRGEYNYLKSKKDFFVQEIEETGKELYGK